MQQRSLCCDIIHQRISRCCNIPCTGL